MLTIPVEYESSICEVKTKENVLLAVGLIKKIGEDFIKICEKNEQLQLVTCGKNVKINIFNSKYGFRVLLGTVLTSTTSEMKIVNVIEIIDRDRRNFFRVDLEMNAVLVYNKKPESDPEKISVFVKDLSLSGLKLELKDELRIGSNVWVELELKSKQCCCQCKIIRLVNEDENHRRQYGCEFLFNEYDDRDLICSFLFQKQREQLRKRRS